MPNPSVTYVFANSTTADATQVNQNFTDLINGITDGTKNISISALTAAGATNLQGAVTLGSSSANNLTFTGSVASNIPYAANATYNIGAATLAPLSLYLGNSTFSTRLIAAALSASYTITLPPAVPAANNSVIEFTTGGVGTFRALVIPTVQTFTSGSGTYTTPANVKYIRVRMVGGGGGGGQSGTSASTNATSGGNSTFGTTLLVANGGGGGVYGFTANGGGSASLGSGPIGFAMAGGRGSGAQVSGNTGTSFGLAGGIGAGTPFGCGGAGGDYTTVGQAAAANTGAGGGGGGTGTSVALNYTGSGGSAGGYVDAIITAPSATYAYAVGSSGNGGLTNANGSNGGAGGSGYIIVEEFYQ